MALYCHKCGKRAMDVDPTCLGCGATLRRGLWGWITRMLGGGRPRVSMKFTMEQDDPRGRESGQAEEAAFTHRQYTYRDSSGREMTFHSLDEMPPEIRRIFDSV